MTDKKGFWQDGEWVEHNDFDIESEEMAQHHAANQANGDEKLWASYAAAALQGCLASDTEAALSAHSAAQWAADIADEMLTNHRQKWGQLPDEVAQQAARAWRPISEAPRDGTLILVTNPSAGSLEPKVSAAFYNSCDDEFPWWFIDPQIGWPEEDQINGWIDDPRLLWQPLPPEPQS